MNPTRRSLLTAAVPGSLLLILLYVILERCGVASAFRIAFGAGAGAFLLVFALLFLRGLRTASAFDRWESEKPAFLYRAPSSLFAAGEKPCLSLRLAKGADVLTLARRLVADYAEARKAAQ